MNSSNVVDITPKVEQGRAQLILGLIPCQNRFFLDIVWPVILPKLQELSDLSRGEWDVYRIWREVFGGSMHLSIGYMDRSGIDVPPEKFQEYFIEKLKTPRTDYVGFFAVQLLDQSAHVFVSAIEPEYAKTNVMELGLNYLEKSIKPLGAPYLQATTHYDNNGVPCTPREWMKKMGFDAVCTIYRKKLL